MSAPPKFRDAPVDNTMAPMPAKGGAARSRTKGDAPQAVLDRYLIERDRLGRPTRFYRDHRATEPMFRDEGRKLIATQSYPDAVADMLKIAQHRGWSNVRVTGDDRFRRETWVQAQSIGLFVEGYRPRDRDRQAAGDRRDPGVPRGASTPPLGKTGEDRLKAAAVVVRRLIQDPAARARLMEQALVRLRERDAGSRIRHRDR